MVLFAPPVVMAIVAVPVVPSPKRKFRLILVPRLAAGKPVAPPA